MVQQEGMGSVEKDGLQSSPRGLTENNASKEQLPLAIFSSSPTVDIWMVDQ